MILHKANPNFLVYDDFFNQEEMSKIWSELTFLTSPDKMLKPEKSGSALDDEGKLLKKNSVIFLESFYGNRNMSYISTITNKVFDNQIAEDLHMVGGLFEFIKIVNVEYNFLSYYEENDYYDSHRDNSVFTALMWLNKEPKKFEGGDLVFESLNETIEYKSNRLVLFPSFLFHAVTPIKMLGDYKPFGGDGRYTMTKFIGIDMNKIK
jgi:Rps23 Pro-64 3,4-dihydroxylase Tpa1-like proline 4-hydroxylase